VAKKDGKAEQTIESRAKLLKILVKRGAKLYEPETIKETIANQTCGAMAEKTMQ
jgi:hypothetical protein